MTNLAATVKRYGGWRLQLAVLLLFVSTMLSAQVNTATVTGIVTDTSGAVIPNAVIQLRNVDTGTLRTTITASDGHFAFNFIAVGSYKITASRESFTPVTLPVMQLGAVEGINLPIRMSPEGVNTIVTVNAGDIGLETTQSVQTTTITEQQMNQLPVLQQSWSSLLELDSGTTLPERGGTTGTNFTGSGVNINGLPASGYNLTVDGTNATSNPEFDSLSFYNGPNVINTVNTDAIAEVSTAQSIPPATVGGAMSGNINIITKSGTNNFHGSLFEVNEVSLYDALNRFTVGRPRTTYNMYGGSIGGPIVRNKLTFFGSYAGARFTTLTNFNSVVPSAYLRSISPAAYASVLALYPFVPQSPAGSTALTTRYRSSASQRQNDGNGMARLDYSINPSNLLMLRYIRARPYLYRPGIPSINPQVTSGHMDNFNLGYVHSHHSWTEDTRIGFNQLLLNRVNGGFPSQLPQMTFAGISTGGANVFLQHGYYLTLEEGVAFVHGNHNVQFGGIFQRQNASRVKLTTPTILYSTTAQYLANTPSSLTIWLYQMPDGTPPFGFITSQIGGYFQDDYRVTPKLTLNLGVRYDYFTVPREYLGRFVNRDIDPARPELGPGFGPVRSADSIYDGDFNNIQPRIGFAFNPRRDLVVRGGVGILVSPHPIYNITGMVQPSATLPGGITLNKQQIAASGLGYPVDATQYPSILTSLQKKGILSTDVAASTVMDAHNPDPYSIQQLLQISQSFGPLRFDVGYVGNRGLNEEFFFNENQPDRVTGIAPAPTFGQFGRFLIGDKSNYNALQTKITGRPSKDLYMSAGYSWAKVNSYGDADLLLQQPPQDNNNLKAEYGPAPFDIRNRFVANAVWSLPLLRFAPRNFFTSALLGGWQISGIFSAQTGRPIDPVNASSTNPSDRPDRGTGNMYVANYRNSRTYQYLNNCMAAACTVNGVTTQGAFIPVPISSNSGAQIRGGTLTRNAVRAPGSQNLNASVGKTVNFGEGMRLQLKMDAFDAFNHANYGRVETRVNVTGFGRLSSASSRRVQLSARFTF